MGGRGAFSQSNKERYFGARNGAAGGGTPSTKIPSSQFQHMVNGKASPGTTAKHVEGIITKNAYETGVIIDSNGFVVAAYKGGKRSVGFSDGKSNDDYSKIKGNTMTHNHPSGTAAFSAADIGVTAEYGGKAVRAATRSNGTAVLEAKNHNSDMKGLARAYAKKYNAAGTKNGFSTSKEANAWLKRNAPKYGCIFRIER